MLRGWDIEIAASGVLSHWDGSVPLGQESENNLWCRMGPENRWCLDVTVGDGDQECWVFRRDPTVRIPWEEAVLRTEQGVPYLALNSNSPTRAATPGPQVDDFDAAEVAPSLLG